MALTGLPAILDQAQVALGSWTTVTVEAPSYQSSHSIEIGVTQKALFLCLFKV